jgi:hypothetical protein
MESFVACAAFAAAVAFAAESAACNFAIESALSGAGPVSGAFLLHAATAASVTTVPRTASE